MVLAFDERSQARNCRVSDWRIYDAGSMNQIFPVIHHSLQRYQNYLIEQIEAALDLVTERSPYLRSLKYLALSACSEICFISKSKALLLSLDLSNSAPRNSFRYLRLELLQPIQSRQSLCQCLETSRVVKWCRGCIMRVAEW